MDGILQFNMALVPRFSAIIYTIFYKINGKTTLTMLTGRKAVVRIRLFRHDKPEKKIKQPK